MGYISTYKFYLEKVLKRISIHFSKLGENYYIDIDGDDPTLFHPPFIPTRRYFQEGHFRDVEEIIEMGQGLFRAIFHTVERRKEILELEDNELVSLRIVSDEEIIQSLPWETFCHVENGRPNFLLQDARYALYRSLPGMSDISLTPIEYPIRLLVILSLPLPVYDNNPISILEEWEAIRNIIEPYIKEGKLEVCVEERANKNRIMEHFAGGKHYHLVHFIGHGMKGGFLQLEAEDNLYGDPVNLDGETLRTIFQGRGIIGVFFNTCESGVEFYHLPSLLYLLQKFCKIPIAVGHQGRIADQDAKLIAEKFYQAIFSGEDLSHSLTRVRRMFPIESPSWWLPAFWLSGNSPGFPPPNGTPKRPSPQFSRLEALPSPGPDFIFRYRPVREAGQAIRDPRIRILLIRGIGGSGKTYLASFLARFYAFLFQGIFSIKCRRDVSPQKILIEAAEMLNSKIENADLRITWNSFSKLIENIGFLFILDNFDELQDKEGFLPTEWEDFILLLLRGNREGKVLITSRSEISLKAWQPGHHEGALETIEVGGFEEREIILYLLLFKESTGLLSKDGNEFMNFINETIGGHPLGLFSLVDALKKYSFNEIKKNPKILLEKAEDRFLRDLISLWSREEIIKVLNLAVPCFPYNRGYYFHASPDAAFRKKIEAWSILERNFPLEPAEYQIPPIVKNLFFKKTSKEDFLKACFFAAEYFEKIGYENKSLKDYIQAFYLWLGSQEIEKADNHLEKMYPFLQTKGYWLEAKSMVYSLLNSPGIQNNEKSKWFHQLGVLAHVQGDYEKAEEYYKKSLEISNELGDKSGISKSFNNLGSLAQDRGDYKEAEEYYKKSLEISNELGDKSGISKSIHQLGILAQVQGDYEKAEEYYKKSLEISNELGDKSGISYSLHNIGILAQAQGDYKKAEEYYKKSLEITNELGDKSGISKSLNQLGILTQVQGDYKKAEEYYKKSLEISNELGNKSGISYSLHNIGILAQAQGDYKKAEEYFTKSLKIKEELGDKRGMSTSFHELGVLAQYRGDYKEAEKYCKKSLEISNELGDKFGISYSFHELGILAQVQGDYKKAEEYYKKSLKIKEELGDKSGILKSFGQLGTMAQVQGDYKKAEIYYKKSLEISNELGDLEGIAMNCFLLSNLYLENKNYQEAIRYIFHSFSILAGIGSPEVTQVFKTILNMRNELGESNFERLIKETEVAPEAYEIFLDLLKSSS